MSINIIYIYVYIFIYKYIKLKFIFYVVVKNMFEHVIVSVKNSFTVFKHEYKKKIIILP